MNNRFDGGNNLLRLALILGLATLIAGCPAPPPPADEGTAETAGPAAEAEQAAAAITEDVLRGIVASLADDKMEGRGPASDGDRMARAYLIEEMQALGLEPGGGDGGWEQTFGVVGVNAEVPQAWTFSGSGGELTLAVWDDFIAASGVQSETASIEGAEVVFVGYGIEAPEYDWDDYKGVDLSGKVLLMLNNDPDWDPELFAGDRRLYYGRWTYKYESAARAGAAGAIIIHTTPSAGYPYQVVQTSWTGEQFELPAEDEVRTQIEAWVTEEAAGKLAELAGQNLATLVESARGRDFQPVPLGVTTSLALANTVNRVETANVGGLLRGSDPQLADEVVVYTAHHDHLGVGTANDSGDTIYNGALDNAAGVAQVLAAAKAFTQLPSPPRRSILFLFVAAEEQGLLGSEYYSRHPIHAPGMYAANINLDGGNIWGKTRDLTYIGYGKSSLDGVVEAMAAAQGRTVKGDQFPDKGYFYRSDQFNFARIGVPAFYPDTGTDFIGREEGWGHEQIEAWTKVHYHQPSDELVDDWNFEGMIADAVLVFHCGYAVAQAEEKQSWNAGDEFEAARLAALAALGE